jgi:hypothetical protein
VVPLGLTTSRFKLFEAPIEKGDEPLLYLEKARAEVAFWPLLRGELVLDVSLEKPKLGYVLQKPVEEELAETTRKLESPLRRLQEMSADLPPYRLNRLEVRDGELLLEDKRERNLPKLWVHDAELTLENFASTAELSRGMPVILALSASLQKSGALSLFLTTNPFTKRPAFAGQMALDHFELNELDSWMRAKSDVTLGGSLSLFSDFEAEDGAIKGNIQPVLEDADVKAAENDLLAKVKAALGDVAITLLTSDAAERDMLVTVVPFKGQIEQPDVGVWRAIVGVLRNAFVEAIGVGFRNLDADAPGAKKSQGRKGTEGRR